MVRLYNFTELSDEEKFKAFKLQSTIDKEDLKDAGVDEEDLDDFVETLACTFAKIEEDDRSEAFLKLFKQEYEEDPIENPYESDEDSED